MDLASEAKTISRAIPRLAERVEVVSNDAGAFNLRGPKLRRHPINRWFAWLLRLPQQVEVELDEVGTFVVKNLGDSSMEQLAQTLGSEYKLTQREAQAALTVFIKSLLQRRLVTMEGWLGTGNA
jgi:hypothetical protein